MNESPTSRRYRSVLTLAAVVVVLLSGCMGSSGVSDDFDLYADGTAAPANSSASTAAPQDDGSTATEESPTDDEAASEGAAASQSGETTQTSSPTPTEAAASQGAGSDDDEDGGSSGAASGSSSGASSSSNPSTTTAASSDGSDACDAYDEQVGPHDRAELESDDAICITEWGDQPEGDAFTVTGVIGNPSGETIDRVSVEVTLYGPDGNVLATKTDELADVGETGRFVVTFEDAFQGENAPAPDDALTYRVHATVGESAETASPTTEAPATTPPTTTSPTTTATTGTTTSTTDASERADACEAYEVREGPRANTELESDDAICIIEWDNQAYQDSYTVTGVIGNPSGETIEHVDVEVTLYKHGDVLATKTVGIDDLGETDRFVVEFVEPFEGDGAPEPVGGISYRIHATVGESTEPGTGTATATPDTTATPAPTPTATPSTTTAEPTPTEPDGGIEGSVESDEYTAVTNHAIDTSGGGVVVTGNLTNPTDARIDYTQVRVTLYDDEGEEIAFESDSVSEEEPISPLLEPGERASFQVTFSDVDPAEVASYTIRSSAMDPAEDPANTRADFAVTFLRLSWLDAPLETYIEVTNQKEETVERLDVVITAYDDNGSVIAEHTERITDLGIGETVTFDHVFEGVPDNEVDRVEVHIPGEDYGFVQ